MVSRLRYGREAIQEEPLSQDFRFRIDAEQMQRVTLIAMMAPAIFLFPDQGWFVPWFVAVVLAFAGASNMCPLALTYRHFGFR